MRKSIILQLTMLLIPLSIFSQINLEDGLIAYYPFNGDAFDESNNANTGAINQAILAEDRFGNANSAYQFDGVDDYIDCGNNSMLNADFSGLTISTWIYLLPGGGSQQQIVGKWNNTMSNDHFTILVHNNKILMAVANPDNSANGYTCDKVLEENTWYHVLVTWNDEGKHRVFIDKSLELDKTSTSIDWISTTSDINLKIGRQIEPTQHNRAFKGMIDDVRIYNRVLSQVEIDALNNFDPSQTTSSVDIEDFKDNTFISPNPASDNVNIQFPSVGEDYSVQIYDSKGQKISNHNSVGKGAISIDIKDLPRGIFFFNISNTHTNITKKVILN